MGVFDKFKDLIGLDEIEEDEDITEEEIEAASAKLERKTIEPKSSYAKQAAASQKPALISKDGKDVKTAQSAGQTRTSSLTTSMKLVVIEPASFDEAPKLVDNLKARKPVIVNLANLDSGVARKIFDFLSGATYALNGNVQKIANSIFVFAPESVDISANVEHKGIDFSGGKSIWR